MILGVDVGGTFTDAVLIDGYELRMAKTPTTPDDQSRGVMSAIDLLLGPGQVEDGAVESFAHGMTVGTNALLEERGARTALIATAGFTDLLDIARQDRPHLYRLDRGRPAPLVGEGLRFAARERIGPHGVIEALDPVAARSVAEAVVASSAEAVAICLLFAHVDPSHERLIADEIARLAPDLHVSCSHAVLPRFREYERCSTTVIDAYLSPLLGRYLDTLAAAARARGLPAPSVMMSSGGSAPAAEAARAGAWSVLSGPAGGAVGAGLIAQLGGEDSVIGLDMGGTSCDVCVVESGQVRRTDSRQIDGRVIQLPMVDVHTVGAGGGSIAWRDGGGAMRVGPRSAGADPGPACYGRGGTEPTVTDANLILGLLAPDSASASGVELELAAARSAVEALAGELGIEPLRCAAGILQIADDELVRALRVVTVERGIDPRGFALLPFGGAGPMHATRIAEQIGIDRILCPRAGGVLSALGLAAAERRRDTARTVMLRGIDLSANRIAAEVEALRATISAGMSAAAVEVAYELRYRGQAFELEVAAGATPDPAELIEGFAREHERRYGYRDDGAEVELVTIRLALVSPGPVPRLRAPAAGGLKRGSRRALFGDQWLEAEVLRGEPGAGVRARGPCIFELAGATLVLPPGWQASVDPCGTIVAEREGTR